MMPFSNVTDIFNGNRMYSEKEVKLFTFFNMEQFLRGWSGVYPPQLYSMAALKAFEKNLKGPEVESLRRCIKALTEASVYRETKEWDDMIEFSENTSS